MPTTVLIVAAHPDDELLGCAGTLARHAAAGDTVHVLILAQGATARDQRRNDAKRAAELESLRAAARDAAAIIGAEAPRFGGLPDNRMDGTDLLDIVKIVEKVVDEVKPMVVYTHHGGDLNIDHQITHRAVLTACRPLPGSSVRAIYAFETLSSTEWGSPVQAAAFQPVHFVDITKHLDQKLRALDCYDSELRPFPHPRSVETVTALARYRGACAGVAAAEGFQVVREIVR